MSVIRSGRFLKLMNMAQDLNALHMSEGMAVHSIARTLQEAGRNNPKTGKPWSKSAIDRVIQKTRENITV